MNVRRGVDGASLIQGGVHVDDILADAVVSTDRVRARILGAFDGQVANFRRVIRPQLLTAHAHVIPTLDRTAATRTFVTLAPPLVMALGHLVQHPRADFHVSLLALVQKVHDRRQTEAGASTLHPLIEDVRVVGRSDRVPERRKRGLVPAIPVVGHVGPCIQIPLHR